MVTITSVGNPRVKAYAKLKNSRERRRTGLFLVEGQREVERAVAAGLAIDTLVVCEELLDAPPIAVEGADLLNVAAAPMRHIAVRENPPGVIAVAKQFDTGLPDLAATDNPLLVICERIEKPGNLGAMIRTADAAGVAAFVVADPVTDLFNPNVVRSSQGALFSVPVATATSEEAISWVRKHDITVFGGYPDATTDMWNAVLDGPIAILVGAEDHGISATWRDVATPLRIPMAGAADSLNAAVSAAVLLFEAVRQRRRRGTNRPHSKT